MTAPGSTLRIGVFDSGVGGLTVLRALRARLPHAHYLYLGDTARLPYGSKSQATIARYAVESVRFLLEQGAEYLVIACNTASALALPEIRAASPVPVLGVIETGADAALAASRSGDVSILATAATVASLAYSAACAERGLRASEMACPLLVPLVEEGWVAHPVTRDVLRIYLAQSTAAARGDALHPDALVLGCTHYPLLRSEIEALVPRGMAVIDSAAVTAEAVTRALGLVADREPVSTGTLAKPPIRFFATDGAERFKALGSRFLDEPIEAVTLIDLGG
ncbi:glutamate racemase [Acidipila sp. EB88]|uniref:glutamate racemase n=1 Tax=Acidipila sp. EB88 TaxID=2305226 RepID=UPI000F5F2BAE|nr:glutamate racemase [Acidipila sp. EB88]RRA48885.1 glutamate racemase [Acidipila sp. EB88]